MCTGSNDDSMKFLLFSERLAFYTNLLSRLPILVYFVAAQMHRLVAVNNNHRTRCSEKLKLVFAFRYSANGE